MKKIEIGLLIAWAIFGMFIAVTKAEITPVTFWCVFISLIVSKINIITMLN